MYQITCIALWTISPTRWIFKKFLAGWIWIWHSLKLSSVIHKISSIDYVEVELCVDVKVPEA